MVACMKIEPMQSTKASHIAPLAVHYRCFQGRDVALAMSALLVMTVAIVSVIAG
jgi:hypothetical protein